MGRASVERFSAEGAAVLAIDVNEAQLRDACVASEKAEWCCVDVRSAGAIDAVRSFRPDVLVNAAGVLRRHEVLEHPLGDWRETMDINLKAVFRLSREFARERMNSEGPSAIVNVSSIEASTAAPAHVAYTASKSGIAMLTKAFALELAEHGIRVNAVAPGVTETGMNEGLRADPEKSAWLRGLIPMGRFGRAEEQAAVIAFLASEDASYVTGAVLASDGGWLCQ